MKDFFYITSNGLKSLRQGSKRQANVFFIFYSDLINQIQLNLMVFMILSLFSILAGVFIIVKNVVLIHKTNNKVISLFGMIKAGDIRGLTTKCEEFSEKFLENKIKKKEKDNYLQNISMLEKTKILEDDQSYLHINPNNVTDIVENKMDVSTIVAVDDKNINNKTNTSFNTTLTNNLKDDKTKAKIVTSQSFLAIPPKSVLNPNLPKKKIEENVDIMAASSKKITIKSNINKEPKKEEEDALKNLEKNEANNDKDLASQANRDDIRQRRLMNSVDNNTKMILIQYALFVLMFWAYFIADYVFVTVFLAEVKNCYSHLELIAERPSIIKYRIVFTYEEIAGSKPQMQQRNMFDSSSELVDVRSDYRDQMYNNEINIFNSLKISYPAQFDEYENQFQILNYGDLCQNYFQSHDPGRFSGFEKINYFIYIESFSYRLQFDG